MAEADHFPFQRVGLTLYLLQKLITFWLNTYDETWSYSIEAGWSGSMLVSKADYFRFKQVGLALHLWRSLVILSFKGLTRLYTCTKCWSLSFSVRLARLYNGDKGWSLSVSAGWPVSIHLTKADNFGFSSLARLYTGDKGWSFSVSAGWPGYILLAKADHFWFQQAGLALYFWQSLINFDISRLS
jgi:hypothetical protein